MSELPPEICKYCRTIWILPLENNVCKRCKPIANQAKLNLIKEIEGILEYIEIAPHLKGRYIEEADWIDFKKQQSGDDGSNN